MPTCVAAMRLLREHYDVVTVGDGLAALSEIQRRRPDIVLSDIMMPQLDGIGLAIKMLG